MTMPRRNVIQTIIAGAAFLHTAENATAAPAIGEKNIFAALNKADGKYFSYIGQDGEPINMVALTQALKDDFTSLSFSVHNCTEYCPMINQRIAHEGNKAKTEKNVNLVSVVVCANPEVDGKTPESRQAFLEGLRNEGIKHKIVVLYPTENGALSNAVVPKIAANATAIVDPSKPLNHSTLIQLYMPGGHRIAEGVSTRPDGFKNWMERIGEAQNHLSRK